MTLFKWDRTANNDATADSTINWSEGQAPSSINDSARAMMAATAKYRDDIAGAIVTAGTSTAYIVSSFQQFDTLAHMNGMEIAFTPHTTNTGTTTLNVDSLGAKPLRSAPNVEIPAGTLIQGTPYTVLYISGDNAFYLKGLFGNPYSIPLGGSIDYWLSTAPNSSFVFPFGQAISRTTYSALFALMGTSYGTGDGSTTFNIPDLRGRVTASPDNMGGSDSGRLAAGATGGLSSVRFTVGGTGGEAAHALIVGEIPPITSTGSVTLNTLSSDESNVLFSNQTAVLTGVAAGGNTVALFNQTVSQSVSHVHVTGGGGSASVTSSGTSGSSHNVVQPTILCNRIMRVI